MESKILQKLEDRSLTKEELDEIFHDMAITINERKKFGIENNGLYLLIAYVQKQILRELVRHYKIKIL